MAVSYVGALRNVLQEYPLHKGLFREILQNSDDAGASKQIFVLDHRTHDGIPDPVKGPALLAYNDAIFSERDFESLFRLWDSSKSKDVSKIGKFGMGFRSTFNLTDTPQVLSEKYLAILDPLRSMYQSDNVKLDASQDPSGVALLPPFALDVFQSNLLPKGENIGKFNGSIVRLPLRTKPSEISSQVFTIEELHRLLSEFIADDIRIVLLFLKQIKTIEVYVIKDAGGKQCLARTTVARSSPEDIAVRTLDNTGLKTVSHVKIEETSDHVDGSTTTRSWRILHAHFKPEDATKKLGQRLGHDVADLLQRHRVQPELALAVEPSALERGQADYGRLFTYLPLPLHTRFCAHLHGQFALMPSRDRLWIREETPGKQNNQGGEASGQLRTEHREKLEWNGLLLEEYLPEVWMYLLLILRDAGVNAYMAWPPPQSTGQFAESGYWERLPEKLLQIIQQTNSPLWPIFGNVEMSLDLGSVFVAGGGERNSLLRTLSGFGMHITQPPSHVIELLRAQGSHVKFLSPSTAHAYLSSHPDIITLRHSQANVDMVLQYLLSENDLNHISDLCLIPTVDGRRIALERRRGGPQVTHTLLDAAASKLFKERENKAVGLNLLDPKLAKLLVQKGSGVLNVQPLSSDITRGYLDVYPTVDDVYPTSITWLSEFWLWLKQWAHGPALFKMIQDLPLLPSQHVLKPVSSVIFNLDGLHPTVLGHLKEIGVNFLHRDFRGRSALSYFKTLGNIDDIRDVLNGLTEQDLLLLDINSTTADGIIKHISGISKHILTPEQTQKLRAFPIFPLASASSSRESHKCRIPSGYKVISATVENLESLPEVPQLVILDGSRITLDVVRLLDPSFQGHYKDVDLVKLSLGHFISQSLRTKRFLVKYMAKHKNQLSKELVDILAQTPFIPTTVSRTSLSKPCDLIDPKSRLVDLFPASSPEFPHPLILPDEYDETFFDNFRALDVMHRTLSNEIVAERIRYIVDNNQQDCARNLLKVIHDTSFTLPSIPEARYAWLPTKNGLLPPSKCRDDVQHLYLFDLVLLPLEHGIETHSQLRILFEWHAPLKLEVLKEQLSAVLNHSLDDAHARLLAIISELIRRALSDSDIRGIKDTVRGRKWVPLSGNRLETTQNTVRSPDYEQLGFYSISHNFSQTKKCVHFFERMGCYERPSSQAILEQLKSIGEQGQSQSNAEKAVALLRALPLDDIPHHELLIPDTAFKLRSASRVMYNDIGERGIYEALGNSVYIAYKEIDENLAESLHIGRLGLKFLGFKSLGISMSEAFKTTITKTLKNYTPSQILTEFIANACDAGATRFDVVMDDSFPGATKDTTKFLHHEMAQFYAHPSLVIRNDSVFTDDDFSGLCNVGVGGKAERSDSIGQFGYGALTMFHLTDLPMILSGKQVLLIDPSKTMLPGRQEAIKLQLKHMKELYPGHLEGLSGLFGLDISSSLEQFNGSLFYLPLRQRVLGDCILGDFWSTNKVKQDLIAPFKDAAEEFLLFTDLKNISVSRRDADRNLHVLWEASSSIKVEEEIGKYKFQNKITKKVEEHTWHIASYSLPRPNNLSSSLVRHRLRSPIVARLAARIDVEDMSRDGHPALQRTSHKLFSTVPLPISCGLPVHLSVPFILSDDRRKVQLENIDPEASSYNKWLLTDVIPPLYLFLLSNLLRMNNSNCQWWPGDVKDYYLKDIAADLVITSFFKKHLKDTDQPVFRHEYDPARHLLPTETVLVSPSADQFEAIFSLVKPPLSKLPFQVFQQATENAGVNYTSREFMRKLLLENGLTQNLDFKLIYKLIRFLSSADSSKDGPKYLLGPHLLPLSDGSFVSFENRQGAGPSYIVARSVVHDLFPSNSLLVHHDFSTLLHSKKVVADLFSTVNIEKFSVSSIKRLFHGFIEEARELVLDREKQGWVNRFCTSYSEMFGDQGPNLDAIVLEIMDFPLVQSGTPALYTSIANCDDRSAVVFLPDASDPRLWDALCRLGLLVVRHHTLPPLLKRIFTLKDFQHHLSLDDVLSAVARKQQTVEVSFSHLEEENASFISKWFRERLQFGLSKDLQHVAKQLPIWPVANKTGLFLPAHEINMLPKGISKDTTRNFFDSDVSVYDKGLFLLGVEPLPPTKVFQLLSLPRVLPSRDIIPYRKLLSAVLLSNQNRKSTFSTDALLIPDALCVPKRPDVLYCRDPLFVAAFRDLQHKFMHESFEEIQSDFVRYGLKQQADLDFDVFRECAQAIHDANKARTVGSDLQERASVVFSSYREALPRLRPSQFSDAAPWSILDDLQFIPRHDSRCKSEIPAGMDPINYVERHDASLLASPNELILSKFGAIAWTQRAFFLDEPDSNDLLLMVYPKLGHPTFDEVVKHLKVLATKILRDFPRSKSILQDLKKTYEWLNDHCDDESSKTTLLEYYQESLYLNVDDPFKETDLVWHSAAELLLDDPSAEDPFHPVRAFLMPFKKLLLAAEVQKIEHVGYSSVSGDENDGSDISLRVQFEKMRQNKVLTDVVFTTSDGEELHAHRVLLATYSSFFYDAFTIEMGDNPSASISNPMGMDVTEYTSHCVSIALDFIYTGKMPEFHSEDLNFLLEMLHLSNYWMASKLKDEVQRSIVEKRLITIRTLERISREAELYEAEPLKKACDDFQKKNWRVIRS